MSPVGVARYIVVAGVFVVCLVAGLRMLLANQEQREIWRNGLPGRWYMRHKTFRNLARAIGTLCLAISGITGYFIVMDLLD